MNIKIISQNIANNPSDFSPEKIEQIFEEHRKYVANQAAAIYQDWEGIHASSQLMSLIRCAGIEDDE